MKKLILTIVSLLTFALLPAIAEQVNVVDSTSTCGDSNNALCTSTFGSSKKIQIIYPANLFTKQVNGDTVDFNYIRGIVLYTDHTDTVHSLPNSYGITIDMWLTQQSNFSDSTSFLTKPSSGVMSFDAAARIDNPNKLLEFVIDKSSSNILNYTSNSNVVVEINITADNNLTWEGNTSYTNSTLCGATTSATSGNAVSFIPKTDFICSRIYRNVKVDGSTYNLYTDKSEAELVSFGIPNNPGDNYYSGYSSTFDGNNTTISTLLFDKYYEFTTVSYTGETTSDGTYSIYSLKNNAFSNFNVTQNVAFEFPTTLSDISSTTAFNFKSIASGKTATIILTRNSYPTFPSNCSTITTDAQKNQINLLFREEIGSAISSDLSSKLTSRFQKLGYVSYPFTVTFPHDPNLSNISRKRTGANADFFNQLLVIQAPYKDNKFSISLDGSVADINNDGTVHFYTKLSPKSFDPYDPIADPNYDNGIITGKLTGFYAFILTSYYYAQLRKEENATAYIDWKEIQGVSGYKFLYRSDSLVFANNDANISPEWKFRNSTNSTVASITTETPIYVKKEINNKKYLFFSLPFNCRISDIEVRYKDVTGLVSHNSDGTIPLLTYNYSNSSYSSEEDKFIILKYIGQDNIDDTTHRGATAVYEQIKNAGEVLQANRGYAFAIIESDNNYFGSTDHSDDTQDRRKDVVAIIRFKDSRGSSEKHLYVDTYNGFSFSSENATSTETLSNVLLKYPANAESYQHSWNRGWSLVGNPFYHSIPASYYGKYATTIGCANCTGEKAVKNVYHHRTDIDNELVISPFEAFFIRADLNDDGTAKSIAINNSSNSGSAIPANSSAAGRKEVISVSLNSDAGQEDYTAVIGVENQDEHFSNADDLPKMFNAGFAEICSYFDGVPCAFKELDLRKDSTRVIPLAVRCPANDTYKIALDTARHYFFGSVVLHDKSLNRYDNLTADGVSVSLTSGYNTSRFELIAVPSKLSTDIENVETSESLESYYHNGSLVIENISEGSLLSIYDISGKQIYSAPASGSFNYDFTVRGVYMVVVTGSTTGSVKVVY